jgi:hypothetical protein
MLLGRLNQVKRDKQCGMSRTAEVILKNKVLRMMFGPIMDDGRYWWKFIMRNLIAFTASKAYEMDACGMKYV